MCSKRSNRSSRSTDDLAEQLSTVLADPRRRHVLSALTSRTRHRSSLDDLAATVTAFECVKADDESPNPTNAEVEVSLYHCHLPKLAEVGIVRDDYLEEDINLTERGLNCANILGVGGCER
jgi:hypothetical protein